MQKCAVKTKVKEIKYINNRNMALENINVKDFMKELDLQIQYITCIECSKPYTAPTTARCGHTLCRSCWSGKKTCPKCLQYLERKLLMLNVPVHYLKEHVHNLYCNFLLTFKDQINRNNVEPIINNGKDPNNYVVDWLTNTENHFSAPLTDSQQSFVRNQCVDYGTSHVQIHSNHKLINDKNSKPAVITHTVPQDDWNKIEDYDESNVDINKKKKSNDIKSGVTSNNLRRSLRKKDNNEIHTYEKSEGKSSDKKLDVNLVSKPHKITKNTVAKMKKEFSKLNKMNRSKLNVSIEMCKKKLVDKPIIVSKPEPVPINHIVNVIENNTPAVTTLFNTDTKISENKQSSLAENKVIQSNTSQSQKNQLSNDELILQGVRENKQNKVSFFKKGALSKNTTVESNEDNIVSNNTDEKLHSNEAKPDDIELTIKIGNTVANIYIQRKENDFKINVDADKIIQTNGNVIYVNRTGTSCSQTRGNLQDQTNHIDKITKSTSITSKSETTTRNSILTKNIFSSKSIEKETEALVKIPCFEQLAKTSQGRTKIVSQVKANNAKQISKSTSTLSKSESTAKASSSKKNTDSADTASVIYEIPGSIEKETSTSDPMHCDELAKASQNRTKIGSQVQANNAKQISKSTSTLSKTESTAKASSSKKNTDSADTTSAIYEIPGSIEKETEALNHMHCDEQPEKTSQEISIAENNCFVNSQTLNKFQTISRDQDNLDNFDYKKSKSQNNKRVREPLGSENTCSKRTKMTQSTQKDAMEQDSENMNYETVLNQVFANIDADMATSQAANESQKLKIPNKDNLQPLHDTSKNEVNNEDVLGAVDNFSENIFTLSKYGGGDSQVLLTSKLKTYERPTKIFPQQKENIVEENSKITSQCSGLMDFCTPVQDDNSDESFCEDTPQKTKSFTKNKSKTETIIQPTEKMTAQDVLNNDDETINISLSNIPSEAKSENMDVNRETAWKTPGSIAKFVNQIKHKSTPLAKKSLNFVSQNDDIDQTLCNSIVAAKNTQEKQFLDKAFEQAISSPVQIRHRGVKKLCIAGSCLSISEQEKLKVLCSQRNWTHKDVYTDDLTHLVVAVDNENKSQRSIKYMCALAAGKWIVGYPWVERCLNAKNFVDESHFEALDSDGQPGPMLSRTATRKLFHNITFYCMPPFTMLNIDTLKNILESAGARVVDDVKHVRVTSSSRSPAMLLAEPEKTEDLNFYYLASNDQVVPVNYEWVINCLGNYKLSSIYDSLLCPAELVLKNTVSWPPELLAQDDE